MIMEILKQILAKAKAHAIIESCENCSHYSVTENYIERYYIKFGDLVGRDELIALLKKVKLNNLGRCK